MQESSNYSFVQTATSVEEASKSPRHQKKRLKGEWYVVCVQVIFCLLLLLALICCKAISPKTFETVRKQYNSAMQGVQDFSQIWLKGESQAQSDKPESMPGDADVV